MNWDWLFRKDEQGVSAAMCLVVLGVLFLVAGFVGGIERGLIMP
ncbi:hypothetical protein [Jeotgalibaca sp. A127]